MKFRSPTEEPVQLSTRGGHTLVVTPDGVDVPEGFRRLAVAAGCRIAGIADEEPDETPSQPSRADLIKGAMRKLVSAPDESDFFNTGKPKTASVSREAGFNVAKEEVDMLWPEVASESSE